MTELEAEYAGERAKTFLPILDDAIAKAETALLETWKATGPERVATREKLHAAVTLLPMIRLALVGVITDGEAAKHSAAMAELLAPAAEDRR